MAMSYPIVRGVRFKDIEGFPGYCVGDDGNIWSCRHPRGYEFAPGRFPWRRLSRIRRKKDGYLVVTLHNRGIKRQFLVHHLVLSAFVGPRIPGTIGCHYPDRDTANNRADNLRWDTYAANEEDKLDHGTRLRGSTNGHAKLSEKDIPVIRDLYVQGWTVTAIARHFGMSRCPIRMILLGQAWKHVPHARVPRTGKAEPMPLFDGAAQPIQSS